MSWRDRVEPVGTPSPAATPSWRSKVEPVEVQSRKREPEASGGIGSAIAGVATKAFEKLPTSIQAGVAATGALFDRAGSGAAARDAAQDDGFIDRSGSLLERGWQGTAGGLVRAAGTMAPGGIGMALRKSARTLEDASASPIAGEKTWDDLKANPTIAGFGQYVVEQGLVSLPEMALLATPGGVAVSATGRAGNIAQTRAQNDGREDASMGDLAIGGVAGGASALLDKFGLDTIFKAPGANFATRIGRAAATEAGTEAIQGVIEGVGGSAGTQAGVDWRQVADDAAAGAVAGGGIGGGIRAGVEISSGIGKRITAKGKREQLADGDVSILSEEDVASPIPNDVIAAGKRPMIEAEAESIEAAVLQKAGMPGIGAQVAYEIPGKPPIMGTVEGAFNETLDGERVAGIIIRTADGKILRDHFDDIADAGASVRELGPDDMTAAADAIDAGLAAAAAQPISQFQQAAGSLQTPVLARDQVTTPSTAGTKFDMGRYMAKNRRAESGGNDQAKAGTSSASGRYQFTDGTWLQYHAKVFGNTGESKAQILAKKGDGAVQDRLMMELTSDNAKALRGAGLPVNDANLYLAHFLGIGGALKMLRAGPQAAVSEVVDAKQIAANKSVFKGRATVGDVIAWASGKMGQPVDAAAMTGGAALPAGQPTEFADVDFGSARRAPVQPIQIRTEERDEVITTARDRDVKVRYGVVEARDLVASNTPDGRVNPNYPADMQPRDRTRASSQMQIQQISSKLRPYWLGRTFRPDDGAPVISPNGVVESGNGRTIAIQKVYEEGGPQAEAYRRFVETQGIDTTGLEQPVLVRLRTEEMDADTARGFAREANMATSLGMAPTEQAFADTDALPEGIMSLYQGGDVDAAANRDFVRRYMDTVMSPAEAANLRRADGSPNPRAYARIRNAMLARAYDNPRLVENLSESNDSNIVAIGGALTDLAGAWSKVRQEIASGQIAPEYDITENVNEAIELVERSRREGRPLVDLVNQREMFTGETTNPVTEAVLRLLFNRPDFTKPAGRKRVRERLQAYLDVAASARTDQGSLLDEPAAPDVAGAIRGARGMEGYEDLAAQTQQTPEPGPAGAREGAPASGEQDAGSGREGVPPQRGEQAGSVSPQATGKPDLTVEQVAPDAQNPENLKAAPTFDPETGLQPGEDSALTENEVSALEWFLSRKGFGASKESPEGQRAVDMLAAGRTRDARDVDTLQNASRLQAKAESEAAPPSIAGQKIDVDWTAFTEASGTLGIPRADMPQVKAEHRGALVNFLNARGIAHEEQEVDPASLKPTQAEFSPANVQKAKEYEGGNRAILVSADNHVVDGHHQWMAARDEGEQIRIIRLDAPIARLLEVVPEMPSATTAEGATETVTPAPDTAQPDMLGGPTADERRQALERRGDAPMRGRGDQRPAGSDGGLFDTAAPQQTDLLDAAAPAEESAPEADVANIAEQVPDAEREARNRRLLDQAVPANEAQGFRITSPNSPGVVRLVMTPELARREALSIAQSQGQFDQQFDAIMAYTGGSATFGPVSIEYGPLENLTGVTPAGQQATAAPEQVEPPAAPRREADSNAPIEDFGEELVGARKHTATAYADRMKDAATLDVADVPLSKSWPEPDYAKLIENGADPYVVAWVHAARDEIPTKPKSPWKLKGWIANVQLLRDMSEKLLRGDIDSDAVRSKMSGDFSRSLRDLQGRVDLYEAVGHERSLKGVTLTYHYYSLYKGRENVSLWAVEQRSKATAFSNWPREIATGDTKQQAIDAFKTRIADGALDAKKARSGPKIAIYSRRNAEPGKQFFIGVSIGKNTVPLKDFETVKEARAYRLSDDGDAWLMAEIAKMKAVPDTRRADNSPRIGIDHRSGADVTPEQFSEAFGFRGVQFGNYVEGPRRQEDLNEAYDALMDLAGIIGVPPRALSLDGQLGLAFGARGKGGKNAALAHYERGTVVINLTKKRGAGSLAHEWWHSLDNYFSRKRGAGDTYLTAQPYERGAGVRPEMVAAFADVMRAIKSTGLKQRAQNLDKVRTKDYWSTDVEMSARAFESYVIAKLQDESFSNDYLVNIVPEAVFGREDSYPYLTAGELPAVRAAFDGFFTAVETRETERGVELYRIPSTTDSAAIDPQRLEAFHADLAQQLQSLGLSDKVALSVVDRIAANPKAAGSYQDGLIRVALASTQDPAFTLNHEAIHALRGMGMLTDMEWATLSRRARDDAALMASIKRRYPDLDDEAQMEEAIADMYARWAAGKLEGKGFVRAAFDRLRSFVEALRNALAGLGMRSADDIMRAVERGDVGRRESGATRDDAVRYAVPAEQAPAQSLFFRSEVTNSPAFRRWFGDSKVTFNDGKTPLVMFHGTSASEGGDAFTMFDTYASNYGLMGMGGYFTADPDVASSYTTKGRGDTPTVYPVYLSIKNPIDMDAPADVEQWMAQFEGVEEFHDGGDTNENWYRAAEELTAAEGMSRWEGAEVMQNGLIAMGYDGITHMGGGRVKSDGVRHRVFIAFDPQQIKSATGNTGAFDPENVDIRFSVPDDGTMERRRGPFDLEERGDVISGLVEAMRGGGSQGGMGSTWKGKTADAWERFRVATQDRYLPLKKAQRRIERAFGKPLPDGMDVYRGEELMHGRIAERIDHLHDDMVRPLFDSMADADVTIEAFESYLYARHAPERNAQIAKINPDMEGAGSGMSDVQAAAIMARIERDGKKDAMEQLAGRLDAIREMTLDAQVEYGLISQERATELRETYQFYVPLRGFKEVEGADPEAAERINRSGSGINVRGPESKRAFGRRSEADSPLAYMLLQAEEAVVRGETNRVAQELYALAEASPNPDFWETQKVTSARRINTETGLVETYTNTLLTQADAPYTVSAKIDGKERRVTFNRDNPSALRLADSMRRLTDSQLDPITKYLGSINRWLSAVNTRFNPEFVIPNMFRDVQSALVNVQDVDVEGITAATVKYYGGALKAAMRGAFGKRDGDWGKWYNEFAMAGAKTAYAQINDVAQIKSTIEKQFAEAASRAGSNKSVMLKVKRAGKAAVDLVENMNDGVENGIRLAAYRAAREAGLSQKQAGSVAKNLTVNFNRRGQFGPAINSLYLFYNASVQGNVRLLQAMYHSKKARGIVGGIVVAGLMMEMLNAMLSADDDDGESFYDKIPSFEKERNIIIMLPDGKDYIKIPLAYGLNAFWTIGRTAGEIGRRGGDRWQESAANLAATILGAFNPIGFSFDGRSWAESAVSLAMPSPLDPIVDLSQNKDFTGRPIMPDGSQFEPEDPAFRRYFPGVGENWKALTDALNEMTGGNKVEAGAISVSPETLEYLTSTVFGAAGGFFDRLASIPGKVEKGEFTVNDVPLVRKTLGQKSPYLDRSAFYQRLEEVDAAVKLGTDLQDAEMTPQLQRFIEDNRRVLTMEELSKEARKVTRQIRKDRRLNDGMLEKGEIDQVDYDANKKRLDEIEATVVENYNRQWVSAVYKVE